MAIGSRIPGSAPIAGRLGILDPDRRLATVRQDVRFRQIDPARRLCTFEQTSVMVDPARRLCTFRQQVIAEGTQPYDPGNRPPAAYVIINGVDVSSRTALDTVTVTHNEDQNSTAQVFVFFPHREEIFVPSFHGKSIKIMTHQIRMDPTSPLITLFTGTIERARHEHKRRGISFSCSDLRDERLGRESQQQLRQMTGAVFSSVTQKDDATGRDYVRELMRTAAGSLGYTRDGHLRYYSWGTTGKPVDFVVTSAEVSYNDLSTEFQTRSEVRNSVTITVQYRYNLLRSVSTTVDAYKMRMLRIGGYSATTPEYDGRAFDRDQLMQKMESFGQWELISHEFYPLEQFTSYNYDGNRQPVLDTLWGPYGKKKYAQGITATLLRRVAQPVREEYTIKLTAPQSIDAYGEEVEGSSHSYAIDTEFDRKLWEEDYKEANKRDPDTSRAAVQAQADNKRPELQQAFNAAYLIGKKELVASHRKNYCSWVRHDIDPRNLGDIVQLDHRIVQTTGQLVGLEYRIADGLRQTSYRVAVSYMDTSMQPPVENWAPPDRPAALPADVSIDSTAEYDTEQGAFNLEIGDISEQYTDEIEQNQTDLTYTVPLEIDGITLING